ncbi:hypothetical protein A9K72_08995 [Mesorhizobium loti]|uniref:Uncharacterized protein n=1 Tax=Mesorhizobium jarvisii TaxID=1777867 RepID=A0AA92XD46_9HYPH|nr:MULTISPECIES: hypothetical protein [Mesorhizobium]OBQ68381.1 hypothetical protein A9K72_08995 [Mesorhizobium loti]RJT31079.1 hypothetical protein D3242_22720 [Mesorhizobium jarvisii]
MITTQQRPAPTIPTAVITSIVERMADTMLEMGMNGTAVTADSLAEHSNFTRAQIEEHGPEAADLAKARAVHHQG